MCNEHVWLFRGCRHSWRSKTYCEDARRAQRQAESGCCGFFTSSPEDVCEVRAVTHLDERPCRQCQRADREAIDRDARNLAKARAEARQAAELYGWEADDAGAGRDSHISRGLYQQAVTILPEREYMEYMPAPAGRSTAPAGRSPAPAGRSPTPAGRLPTPASRSLTVRTIRGAARGEAIPMTPFPPPVAVTRAQVRRGAGAANGPRHRTERTPQERRQAQSEIRNDYNNIVRSAGLSLPLPRPQHEAADEFDEPLPDEEFLDMVSRAG